MKRQYELLPLFSKLISDSLKGRRLKPNGKKISKDTVCNYTYVYKHLKEFSEKCNFTLRIREFDKLTKRERIAEGKYWKNFYFDFTHYLFSKKHFDNYVGSSIKIIRIFFNYLQKEKQISIGSYYKSFYVNREEIPIILLSFEQLQFLIFNKEFEQSLPAHLGHTKDIFVFGCSVALRFSDLFSVKYNDLEVFNGKVYLKNKSLKTEQEVKILLPEYAMVLIEQKKLLANSNKTIFKKMSLRTFNSHLKQIGELAGWTNEVTKKRSRQGAFIEIKFSNQNRNYRFCDLLSSHAMRRTAITTMLTLGMSEDLVRKISGHAAKSASFFRYVKYTQPYIDREIEMVHNKMKSVNQ